MNNVKLHSDGIFGEIAGRLDVVKDHYYNGGQQNSYHNNNENSGLCLGLLGFLSLFFLPLGHAGGFQLLAELLFAGCTHVIISSRWLPYVRICT